MKKLSLLFCFLFISLNTNAQNSKYLKKVQTLDSTIKTLYDVISGDKGEARNWELFYYLFKPEAKLIPTSTNQQGITNTTYMLPQEYVKSSGAFITNMGFHEKEVARTVHKFGNIVQVFSTYYGYNNQSKTKPFLRGINSIQLLNDGKRWWIVNIYWQQASAKNPIPKEFMPQ